MTLSWISRRNGDSFEPPWVDLIFPRPSASERRIRKISPTQSKSSSPCTTLHASWARRGPPGRYHERPRVSGGQVLIRSPRRHAAKLRTTGASRKIATRVATPARLRAMAARKRHVGRIVGRAGAALQLGDCRATGRGHLAHKGRTDALHVCSGWRRILRCPLDLIIAVKKLISTSVFGCPRLYFFALRGEQTSSRAASRRGVPPARFFIFARWR